MSHTFQDALPTAEAGRVATAILSKTFSRAHIRDAWVVAEYAVARVTDDGLIGMMPPGETAETEVLEILAAASEAEPGLATALPIPWSLVVRVVFKAILAAL